MLVRPMKNARAGWLAKGRITQPIPLHSHIEAIAATQVSVPREIQKTNKHNGVKDFLRHSRSCIAEPRASQFVTIFPREEHWAGRYSC